MQTTEQRHRDLLYKLNKRIDDMKAAHAAAVERVLEALEVEYDGLVSRGEQHRKAVSIKFAMSIVRREMGKNTKGDEQ